MGDTTNRPTLHRGRVCLKELEGNKVNWEGDHVCIGNIRLLGYRRLQGKWAKGNSGREKANGENYKVANLMGKRKDQKT